MVVVAIWVLVTSFSAQYLFVVFPVLKNPAGRPPARRGKPLGGNEFWSCVGKRLGEFFPGGAQKPSGSQSF
jgi:hypothetical protein